jgi:hypothetical protein
MTFTRGTHMTTLTLTAWNTGATLFAGQFSSWKTCLEAAISDNVTLDYLYLEGIDFGPANLDGARMNYARLRSCGLKGANLSEASLIKSDWQGCDLRDICLSNSVLVGARFSESALSGTDVSFADLRGLRTTCPDFLKCDFAHSTSLVGSAFHIQGLICPMTRTPVYVRGLGMDTVLLDEHVIIGGKTVLRRDQLVSHDGLIRIFAEQGLKPHPELLRGVWNVIRGDFPAHIHAA